MSPVATRSPTCRRRIRDRNRLIGAGAPIVARYERVCFDRDRVRLPGSVRAELLTPCHPLLETIVDLTVEGNASTLKQGAILVDRSDLGETPRLLVALTQAIDNGHQPAFTVSKRFEFVELTPDGGTRAGSPAPYLDYESITAEETVAVAQVVEQPWLARGYEDVAVEWAVEHRLAEHLSEVEQRIKSAVVRARTQVRGRLQSEINYWDTRHATLLDQAAAGRDLRIRPETAYRRARELENRLGTT